MNRLGYCREVIEGGAKGIIYGRSEKSIEV